MGDNFTECKNGKIIFCSKPRVKNKFLQKIVVKLFGYDFLYKEKHIVSSDFTIKSFDADTMSIDN